jgi:RNA polymerase sigma-70 factor (ECF subfamily)
MKDDAGPLVNAPVASSACPNTEAYPTYFAELYLKSGGKFGLSFLEFVTILQRLNAKSLASDASFDEIAGFHSSLRLEDLVLARACANGNESAWEYFLEHYRPKLYASALAMAREESVARELADSLYSELFGLHLDAEGRRISKLESYTGRGSLEGWLRAVLAREYLNRHRKERRLEPLDDKIHVGEPPRTDASAPDPRLEQAINAAWGALSAEERLILGWYYFDKRTLAEVAMLLRVHESTVSRRVRKITENVRKRILGELRRCGMSKRQVEEALEVDVRDLAPDIRVPSRQEKQL